MASEAMRLEDIQNSCDYTIVKHIDQFYNPFIKNHVIVYETIDIQFFDQLTSSRVFILSDCFYDFITYLRKKSIYVHIDTLYVGNGDVNFNNVLSDHLTWNKAYFQNLTQEVQNTFILPIMLENRMWDKYRGIKTHIVDQLYKKNDYFLSINVNTNPLERLMVEKFYNSMGIANIQYDKQEYYKKLAKSRYHSCPEGNGHDTHRFWECLYHKCIPIVRRTPFIELLNKQYPIIPMLIIDQWTSEANMILTTDDSNDAWTFDVESFLKQFLTNN